jgi:hypothetical protein
VFLYRSQIKLRNGSIWPAAFHISLTKVVPGLPCFHVKLTAAVNLPWLARPATDAAQARLSVQKKLNAKDVSEVRSKVLFLSGRRDINIDFAG